MPISSSAFQAQTEVNWWQRLQEKKNGKKIERVSRLEEQSAAYPFLFQIKLKCWSHKLGTQTEPLQAGGQRAAPLTRLTNSH